MALWQTMLRLPVGQPQLVELLRDLQQLHLASEAEHMLCVASVCVP